MKRILISAVLALALAGTSAFAAQNKNTGGKKPASKTSNTTMASNTGGSKSKGKSKSKRRHKKGKGKGSANKNAGGGSMTKTKPKNSK